MYAGDGTTGLPQAGDGSDRAKYLPVYWMSFCVLLCEPRRLRPAPAPPRHAVLFGHLAFRCPERACCMLLALEPDSLPTRQRALGPWAARALDSNLLCHFCCVPAYISRTVFRLARKRR